MSYSAWNAATDHISDLSETRAQEMAFLRVALELARETGFVGLTLPRVEAVQGGISVGALEPPLDIYKHWPTKDAIAFSLVDVSIHAAFHCAGRAFHATMSAHAEASPEHIPDTRTFRWYIQCYFQCLVRMLDREREFTWEALGALFVRWPLFGERLALQRSLANGVFLHPADFGSKKGPTPEPRSLVGFARSRGLIETPAPEVYHAIRATLWSYFWAVVLRWHVDTSPGSQATSDFIEQTARYPASAVQCHWLYDADSIESFLLTSLWQPLNAQLQGIWLPAPLQRVLDMITKPKGGIGSLMDALPGSVQNAFKPTMGAPHAPGAGHGDE